MYKNEPIIDQLKRDGWEIVYADELFEIIKNPEKT